MRVPSYDLLGIRLHAMTRQDLVGAVAQAVDDRTHCLIGNHNLHSLYLWFHEPKMRQLHSVADYIHIDGMSLVWLGRLFGLPFRSEHRTGYMDLLPVLAGEAIKHKWRIFYLGSRPGVAEKAARLLERKYAGLEISTHHGYFDTQRAGEDNRSVLAQINDYDPDVLMVGMGMPRQEAWILENRNDLPARAIFCCGALMDYVAGEIPTPPRWLGPVGLEWLYRLVSEPARLWRRYLVEPWSILGQMTSQYMRKSQRRISPEIGTHE